MIKKIINTFLTRTLSSIFAFILLLFTTHLLGSSGRGVISIISSTIGISVLFNGFVGGASLVYIIPKNKPTLSQILTLCYPWSIFVGVLIPYIFFLIGVIWKVYVIDTMVLSFISSIISINTIILLSYEAINMYNLITLLQVFLNLSIFSTLGLFLKKVGVDIYIMSLYISDIITFILSVFFIFRIYVRFMVRNSPVKVPYAVLSKNIIGYGFVLQLGNVIQLLNYRLSYFVLNHYIGEKSVGVYSVGIVIAEFIWIISRSIALVQYSKIANINDVNYSRSITVKLLKMGVLISFFVLLLLLSLPTDIFKGIFGKEFGDVKQILFFLSPGILSFSGAIIISHYFSGLGRYSINTIASIIGLIVTIIFSFSLIPKYGYIGASIGSSLSYICTGFCLFYIFTRETKYALKRYIPTKEDFLPFIDMVRNWFFG